MKKLLAALAAALGIGVAAAVASAKNVDITAPVVVQADSVLLVATWDRQCNATGCPDAYKVEWFINGASIGGVTTPTRVDSVWVRFAGNAITSRVTVQAVRGSKMVVAVAAERVVQRPAPPPPVDSTPLPVVNLKIDATYAAADSTPTTPPDTTPVPPPTPNGFIDPSHIPAGLSLWFDDDLDNMAQDEFPAPNSQLRWGFRNNGDWRTRDVTTPYSDGVLRVPFSGGGYGDGYGVGLILREEGCWPRMYVVAMEKFEGSGGQPYKVHFNEEKTVFPRTRVCSSGALDNSGPDIAYVGGRNGHDVEVQLQNGLGSPRRYQNRPVWYTLGQWHKVEHYMQANTPGRQDGIWRMWIDGQLAAEYTNVDYSANASEQVGFWGVRWESVRGGGRDNAPTPPGGQFRIYDRLAAYVSDKVR